MKKQLKALRRATAACAALNKLVLSCMAAALLTLVILASAFWLWWYPINYLTESDRFHEQRMAKFMDCVGFKDIAHSNIAMPKNQFRDFKTTCSIWVTIDDGHTYQPIEFTYRYERRGWLSGTSFFSPTRESFANKHASVLDKYLEWSGTTREQCEEIFLRKDQIARKESSK